MVNGVRLRLLSLRGSWVQIPPPAPFSCPGPTSYGSVGANVVSFFKGAPVVSSPCNKNFAVAGGSAVIKVSVIIST